MVVNNIKVYARIKKQRKCNERAFEIIKKNEQYEDIVFHKSSLGNGRADNNRYRFCKVFDEEHTQSYVFDSVVKPVVTSVLQGFNGTVFAYGQTGSGKTYSMTGSTNKYEKRGIIPRSLEYLFSSIETTTEKPTLYVSYMEIYNEVCYDLLSRRNSRTARKLEELPSVMILEDKKGHAHYRNLSVLPVSTEEEAMRLLFFGETNRALAETPLNEYSSRSHCIFTVYITTRANDGESMRYSKLNLVDLAGSERVYKSGITGHVLAEAKFINLSLHFLQQIFLALSEEQRPHNPYRNSLMTFILKDSLAGNCVTVMLTTLDISRKSMPETISTCKFAQRVLLIKTNPVLNVVSNPYEEIQLLRNEVQELRKRLAEREKEPSPLSNKQKKDITGHLNAYLKTDDQSFQTNINPGQFQYCLQFLKTKIKTLEDALQKKESMEEALKASLEEHKHKSSGICEINEKSTGRLDYSSKDVDYYTKLLDTKYRKAVSLSTIIENCQVKINDIRERVDHMSTSGNGSSRTALCKELEDQQNIYKSSLRELKDLKCETLQVEAGLVKARTKMNRKFERWNENKNHEESIESAQLPGYTCHRNCTKTFSNSLLSSRNDYDQRNNFNTESFKHFMSRRITRHIPQCSCYDNVKTEICRECRSELFCQNYHSTTHNLEKKWLENCSGENLVFPTLFSCSNCDIPIHTVIMPKSSEKPEKCYCQILKVNETEGKHHKQTSDIQLVPNKLGMEDFKPNITVSIDYISKRPTCSNEAKFGELLPTKINNDDHSTLEIKECDSRYFNGKKAHVSDMMEDSPKRQEKLDNKEPHMITTTSHTQRDTIADVIKSPSPLRTEKYEKSSENKKSTNIVNRNYQISQTTEEVPNFLSSSNLEIVPLETDNLEPDGINKRKNAKTFEIFLNTDTEDFKKFMGTVSLTGDADLDREICSFYRTKMC